MRARTRIAAIVPAVALASAAIMQAQVAPVYQVVVAVDPVAVDVAVTDAQGRSVSDLTREDFVVYEDGEPQELRDVELVGMPYSILVLVDRSARETRSNWPKFVLNSVDLFLKNLRGPDRLAIAAFDNRVAVLVDWRPSRNGNRQRVLLRKSTQPTRFFDAVNWASEEMRFVAVGGTQSQPYTNGRRGVIVFTDGRDVEMYPQYQRIDGKTVPDPGYEVPASVDLRFERSRQILQNGKVPFYFVAVDTDRQLTEKSATAKLEGWVRFLREVRTRIEQLAASSGGHAAFPTDIEDLLPLYDRIQRELGTGYHITYNSLRPADGKARRVEVRLRDKDLHFHQSITSYFPR
jgi:VWFA-related protein